MFLAMSTGFSSRLGGVRWDLESDMSRKWDLEAPGRERPDTFAEIQRSPLACSDVNRMVPIFRNRASEWQQLCHFTPRKASVHIHCSFAWLSGPANLISYLLV